MDFDLNDEQRLLSESVNRFIADRYDFHAREAAMKQPEGFSREIWAQMAEMGLLGLPFAEADGGFGCGPVETMLVMEALGKGLVLEPYLATVVLAGGILRRVANEAQRAERVPAIITGDHVMALAHQEWPGPRHTTNRLMTRGVPVDGGWRLSGAKVAVIAGHAADELVVSAATPDGVGLFFVDPRADGIVRTTRAGYDGVRLADIAFADVHLKASALLGTAGGGGAVLDAVFEEANAALAAEAVGIMQDVLGMTADYLRTRTQFGVAIGSFQALQHRAVDMLMQVELSRSMAMLAAMSLDRPTGERRLHIAAVKAKIGQAGRFVGQQAVQLHGAIGLTNEYKIGHGFKRLTAIDALFGDSDHHLDMLAEAGGVPAIA
ncbi:acyl-CoA dehydrogenase [Niveispirillum sp.]|uniref:acyl-CoA dehydrogenase family protein n=1 Tax=Niveispirillum sp. TaxID=1917217 RepID=UPI001B6A35A9|nr:acyl-CoA dehydrogenase [Niveispirillum sp.]MBP7335655.1 acyl-CoA dehydrogenase family protein [Niveispirillum sp.]